MPLTAEDQAKYKTLYLQTAREYITALKDNVSLLLSGKESPEAIEILHRSAHSLTSQSKMMEYEQIAQVASVLETICKEKHENNPSLSQELLNAMNEAVQQMEIGLDSIDKNNKEINMSESVKKLHTFIGKN